MEIIIKDISQLKEAARKLIEYMGDKRIFAFYGSMGAGKTTLIKAICEQMGSIDVATSPTFTLVNEYNTSGGEILYHFDFFRIEKIEEVFDFGFEEYLQSGNHCFMEWPEKIEDLLPEETVMVKINVNDDGSRKVILP